MKDKLLPDIKHGFFWCEENVNLNLKLTQGLYFLKEQSKNLFSHKLMPSSPTMGFLKCEGKCDPNTQMEIVLENIIVPYILLIMFNLILFYFISFYILFLYCNRYLIIIKMLQWFLDWNEPNLLFLYWIFFIDIV